MDQFIRFIHKPTFNGEFKKPSVGDILLPLLGYFLLVIPIGVILFIITTQLGISPKILQLSYPERLVYGILLTPLIEEIYFRLIYVFSKRNLYIVLFTTLCLIIVFILKSETHKIYLFLSIFLLISILLVFYKKCNSGFNYHFKFFFYAFAALFAILHLFNFSGYEPTKIILVILFVIPQFILGIILGYLRLTFGFLYAVLFHSLVNLSLLL